MEQPNIIQFLLAHANKFPLDAQAQVQEKLNSMDDSQLSALMAEPWKSPGKSLWFAGYLGGFGADRFYLGQTGLGILKLLTGGGCGIWALIDFWYGLPNARKVNLKRLLSM